MSLVSSLPTIVSTIVPILKKYILKVDVLPIICICFLGGAEILKRVLYTNRSHNPNEPNIYAIEPNSIKLLELELWRNKINWSQWSHGSVGLLFSFMGYFVLFFYFCDKTGIVDFLAPML